jgi:hypothetical protein
MRNTEKVRRSTASNLLVQFSLAELTLQLMVDPSKSRRSIPARADGRSQQKPTVDPSKSRRQEPTVDPDMQLHRHCTSGDHGRLAQQWHMAWGTNNEGLLSHGWGGSCSLGVGEIWKSEATMDGSWWEGEA